MGYYDEGKNVRQYIQMAEGYDGEFIISRLTEFLPVGKTVLELGMGPGKDLEILQKFYTVTGSDLSLLFINLFRQDHPDADLVVLDAVTLDIERTFDAIYSNKVLYHLTSEQLLQSLMRQWEILEPAGIVCHTFWHGQGEETQHGLYFKYYQLDELLRIIPDRFNVLTAELYREMEVDDSILLILQKQ
ncbi:MAG: class I SAM-dependent methyltransferase [Ardenticatenaceae bacterium]|nr:class I SAM-dependent methyltransferase [Ardenticatenaceae bacterium]